LVAGDVTVENAGGDEGVGLSLDEFQYGGQGYEYPSTDVTATPRPTSTEPAPHA
jgi:hypothetical protein